jgi:hypothetical protein
VREVAMLGREEAERRIEDAHRAERRVAIYGED